MNGRINWVTHIASYELAIVAHFAEIVITVSGVALCPMVTVIPEIAGSPSNANERHEIGCVGLPFPFAASCNRKE